LICAAVQATAAQFTRPNIARGLAQREELFADSR